jgi:transposase
MTELADVAVIGAGVVGLGVARRSRAMSSSPAGSRREDGMKRLAATDVVDKAPQWCTRSCAARWRPAMEHIGIDVHKVESQLCILTESGEIFERRIRTQRERFAAVLGERAPGRILIEASTESEWVARCLEQLGHEVVVADPNFAAMYATRSRRVKTDRRDARTLAEACRLGAYRPAHRTSDGQRHVRAQLAVREALVQTRSRYISLLGAVLRREGFRVGTGNAEGFVKRVERLALPGQLRSEIAPLLAVLLVGQPLTGPLVTAPLVGRVP